MALQVTPKLSNMHFKELTIPAQLPDGNIVRIILASELGSDKSLFEIDRREAAENGESPYQILEGCAYEYTISTEYSLEAIPGVVSHSLFNSSTGRITPNIYVGTLSINIVDNAADKICGKILLEVRSVKTTYRSDYRMMLEEITEKCTDLVMQHSSPANQLFDANFDGDPDTLYQQFAFIKSILDSDEFYEAVHQVLLAPVTKWVVIEVEKDIRNARRISNGILRQIAVTPRRINLPTGHQLNEKLNSVPARLVLTNKRETVDTAENRFIKYALQSFSSLCGVFKDKLNKENRLAQEAATMEERLEQLLSHSVFREVSKLDILPLNSPVLQRKEGYRELLRTWLMFNVASKLVWKGGDDVYGAGKRNVAALYEYWLFFKLLDVIGSVFQIEPEGIDKLIEPTKDGLGLKLKQGIHLPLKGTYIAPSRKLSIEFSYNRTFSEASTYPNRGSWTTSLRPDYTLTVWPFGIDQEEAEKEELIVHIHFDAKYKIENLIYAVDPDQEDEDIAGKHRRSDLLKMHTYRDAIRRTAGAYILYPGTESKKMRGFHEILPGLGAFSIRPSKTNNGIHELVVFLNEVVKLFLNRASQREKMSLKTYETYKENDSNEINESLPEPYGSNRLLIPDETFVLVGYYKNEEQLKWMLKSNLYNTRIGSGNGSLRLRPAEANAQYLLLHTSSETKTDRLFKIIEKGPRVFSKENLLRKGYPNPSQDFYLVFEIEAISSTDFQKMCWDITRLAGYMPNRASAYPFAVSMTELMKTLVR